MRFPRSRPGKQEAVLLNTAGGLADGDSLLTELRWRRRTRATVTTQAAERVYRAAASDVAQVTTRISLEEDATACWLPQETIVFDGARFERTLEIDMPSTSRLIALESTVFGRKAMGESVSRGRFLERWRVRIDGRLDLADNFLVDDRLTGDISAHLGRAAVTHGAHCLATVVIVAPDGEDIVARLRNLADPPNGTIAATCLGRLVVARILARDNQALRSALILIVGALGETLDVQLPRVWDC